MDTHKVIAFEDTYYLDAKWQGWVEQARGSKEFCMGFAKALRQHTPYKTRIRQIKNVGK